jgi:hypothetical protein
LESEPRISGPDSFQRRASSFKWRNPQLERPWWRDVTNKLWIKPSRGARIGSIVGAAAILPCATYIGVVLGTLGGGWSWSIGGIVGAWVGIILTVLSVGGSIALAGATIGGIVGAVTGCLFKPP